MKVEIKTPNGRAQKRVHTAPIPLERSEHKESAKGDIIRFKLRTTPADDDSPTYELSVNTFETGTPEELLDFVENVSKVIVGQNATTGPPKYALMRRMLKGDAKAAFNAGATAAGAETNVNFNTSVNALIRHVFPSRSLALQKRVMRRYMRKPKEMTMRTFMARIVEINNKLSKFPPFGGDAQKMDDSELLDIGEFATPNTWQREMIVQDFDPLAGTTQDLVDFCERMERTKELDAPIPKKPQTTNKESSLRRKLQVKWCEFCDMNNHNTKDCFKLKALKRKNHEQATTQHDGNNRQHKRGRSTYVRRSGHDAQPGHGSETIAAIAAQAVLQVMKAKKEAGSRKRKTEDLCVVEGTQDFANLSISSDSEASNAED